MAENNMQAAQAKEAVSAGAHKEKSKEVNLASALEVLSKFGGFNFLASTVDGLQNLNPDRKARNKIFLTYDKKQAELEIL